MCIIGFFVACVNGKVFNSCGTMCPMTCENKDNPPLICPLACKSGCVCPFGTVEYNDGCVLPEDCPTSELLHLQFCLKTCTCNSCNIVM